MLPKIEKILFATDLSPTSRHALSFAASLGATYGAEVTMLHVIPDVVEGMSQSAGFDIEEHFGRELWEEFNNAAYINAKQAAHERVREFARQCAAEIANCPFSENSVRIEIGQADRRIVQIAQDEKYHLIVIGTHGQSGLMDALLGGVAHSVVRRSPVPVLTVRPPSAISE